MHYSESVLFRNRVVEILSVFANETESPGYSHTLYDHLCSANAPLFGGSLYDDDNMRHKLFEYFKNTVIPNKIEVLKAGTQLIKDGIAAKYLFPKEIDEFKSNLVFHDLSKFSNNESVGYALYDRKTGEGKEVFERAWHHHKMHNPHHPEHWLNPNRSGELEPIPMPALYLMEMIADWMCAKRYGSTLKQWLPDNLHKFKFGPGKGLIRNILADLGIQTWIHEGNVLKTTPE